MAVDGDATTTTGRGGVHQYITCLLLGVKQQAKRQPFVVSFPPFARRYYNNDHTKTEEFEVEDEATSVLRTSSKWNLGDDKGKSRLDPLDYSNLHTRYFFFCSSSSSSNLLAVLRIRSSSTSYLFTTVVNSLL